MVPDFSEREAVEHIEQLEGLLYALTNKPNLENFIEAVEYANENKGITIGLTGFDGGNLLKIVKEAIHVPSEKGEYGPVEDVHMIIDHLVSSYLRYLCTSD